MSNWDTTFAIGDRVTVTVAHTCRDKRTHRIVVKHSYDAGRIHTLDLDSEDIGVGFDNGQVREVHNYNVHKMS